MPKVNLLNRIKKQQLQKRKNSVWIIVTEQNDREYYILKVDKDGIAAFWTDNRLKAMRFHTEKGCQHFIKAFLGDRSDIHLEWMEVTA